MTSCVVSRRCMFLMTCNFNHDQQLRYSSLILPWYKFSAQKQNVSNFCSSKKTSKNPSKTASLRRPKKDASNVIKSSQSVNENTSADLKLGLVAPPSDPITPSSDSAPSPPANNVLDILSMQRPDVHFTSVYVHPLSQIILNHFQTHCHDWIRSKRLDNNLILHQDGTFVIQSSGRKPSRIEAPSTASMKSSILLNKNFRFILPYSDQRVVRGQSTARASSPSSIRIWTSYDTSEGKHWLCVSMEESRFSTKYLLQDNSLTPWQGFKLRSVPERVCASVHELMKAVNDYENFRNQWCLLISFMEVIYHAR